MQSCRAAGRRSRSTTFERLDQDVSKRSASPTPGGSHLSPIVSDSPAFSSIGCSKASTTIPSC